MLNSTQEKLLELLKQKPYLLSGEVCRKLQISRARLCQIVKPLIRKKLIAREGKARATRLQLTGQPDVDHLRRENWELKRRVKELETTLDDRKIIERAKEILMAQFDILPTEAYRKLQEQSMDSGKSMRQIAERLLQAYEF